MIKFGIPAIYFTFCPSDENSPLVAHFSGQNINLDCSSLVPDFHARKVLVAENPVAAAKFFDTTVRVLIKELFGFPLRVDKAMDTGEPFAGGLFGMPKCYFGTVEVRVIMQTNCKLLNLTYCQNVCHYANYLNLLTLC
jgi:hypothetical protein